MSSAPSSGWGLKLPATRLGRQLGRETCPPNTRTLVQPWPNRPLGVKQLLLTWGCPLTCPRTRPGPHLHTQGRRRGKQMGHSAHLALFLALPESNIAVLRIDAGDTDNAAENCPHRLAMEQWQATNHPTQRGTREGSCGWQLLKGEPCFAPCHAQGAGHPAQYIAGVETMCLSE